MKRPPSPLLVATLGLLALFPTSEAHAYLDPGSGSILIQMLVGGVAGLVVAGRLYWRKVMSFFRPKPSDIAE